MPRPTAAQPRFKPGARSTPHDYFILLPYRYARQKCRGRATSPPTSTSDSSAYQHPPDMNELGVHRPDYK